jgi:ABC-type metal ion transport system substrate-binding protein
MWIAKVQLISINQQFINNKFFTCLNSLEIKRKRNTEILKKLCKAGNKSPEIDLKIIIFSFYFTPDDKLFQKIYF